MSTAKRILKEAIGDDITGEAAKMAYYFFLSLFPLILAIFAFSGIVGGDALFDRIMAALTGAVPPETASLLERLIREITGTRRPAILSFGLILTLWSASNIFSALIGGLNRMYNVKEERSWWKRKALAVLALPVGYLLLLIGGVALLAGPEILRSVGVGATWVWTVLRWPLVFAALAGGLWLAYYVLPHGWRGRGKREITWGALIGTALWIAVTVGFRLYVVNFGDYSATYGFIGGIIVLLLWLYLSALAVLFGGEIASTLEQKHERERGGRAAPESERPAGSAA